MFGVKQDAGGLCTRLPRNTLTTTLALRAPASLTTTWLLLKLESAVCYEEEGCLLEDVLVVIIHTCPDPDSDTSRSPPFLGRAIV
jgi:hypothetical protein